MLGSPGHTPSASCPPRIGRNSQRSSGVGQGDVGHARGGLSTSPSPGTEEIENIIVTCGFFALLVEFYLFAVPNVHVLMHLIASGR